jgi:Calcineurin-like phosphoesterase
VPIGENDSLRIVATSDLGATTVPLPASYGAGGTCAGAAALLEREREDGPAVWLDAGDLVVGHPSHVVLGERPWGEVRDLPIAAAGVGNHELDDGVPALLEAADGLGFPLLCANLDIGLPPATLLPEGVGVIALTHPHVDRFTPAPPPAPDWPERVPELARSLRADGARWVVALLHDGVEWWPAGASVATRPDRLDALAAPWAAHVDLILCGHNFAGWTGTLGGTPAGQPHVFAGSAVIAELGDEVRVRLERIPSLRGSTTTAATDVVDAAAANVVGRLSDAWLARTGASRYLPDLYADAFRRATGAGAGLAPPEFHGTQPPLDGAMGVLGPGPVTELDLLRPFASPDYTLVVAELRPGELRAALRTQWAYADPRNREADGEHWNWCRMPAGVSAPDGDTATVAVIPAVAAQLAGWLGRELEVAPTEVTAAAAVASVLA